jgi:hypothetical protein
MQIGPWWLPPYTLRMTLGTLSGLCWLGIVSISDMFLRLDFIAQYPVLATLTIKLAKASKSIYNAHRPSRVTLGLLWATSIAALIAGRWGYIMGNWSYFAQNPAAILQLRQVGGLHGGSAWVGGLLAAGLWARTQRVFVSDVIARLSPLAFLTAAGAWWGCAAVGCAWGREAWRASTWTQQIIIVEAPDMYHTVVPRYAVQNLGMVWALAMALFAIIVPRCGALAIAVYLLGEAALTQVRADPVPTLGPYRIDLLLNLGLSLFIWFVQWHSWHTRSRVPHKI